MISSILLNVLISIIDPTTSNGCGSLPIQLYFANGMLNSYKDAKYSYKILNTKLKNYLLLKDPSLLYLLLEPATGKDPIAYNLSEGIILDLFQSSRQKSVDDAGQFWRYLSNLPLAPQWFKEKYKKIYQKFILAANYRDEDLKNHIQTYLEELKIRKNILIVAHSQGNFYANFAYEGVQNKNDNKTDAELKIVAVANPASYVAGKGPYSNLSSDGVVTSIPNSLPANVSNSNPGLFDHEFVQDYLNGDKSGEKILTDLHSSLKAFLSKKEKEFSSDISPDSAENFLFLDSSLLPVWAWAEELRKNPPSKLSPAECLAVGMFYTNYDLFGASCAERSLKETIKRMHKCVKLDQTYKDNGCFLVHKTPDGYADLGGNRGGGGLVSGPYQWGVFSKSDLCIWSADEYRNGLSSIAIEAEKELLKKREPPKIKITNAGGIRIGE